MPIDYKEVAQKTGKSVSTIKKWRLKIETLSGYEFTKTKARVSHRSVQVFYEFSEDEVTKFIELAKEIALTKDLDSSVKKVWGDLNAQLERDLGQEISRMRTWIVKYKQATDKRIDALDTANTRLAQRVYALEETIKELQEEKSSSLFSKLTKRGK